MSAEARQAAKYKGMVALGISKSKVWTLKQGSVVQVPDNGVARPGDNQHSEVVRFSDNLNLDRRRVSEWRIDRGQASGEVARQDRHPGSVRSSDTEPTTFDDLNLDRRRVSDEAVEARNHVIKVKHETMADLLRIEIRAESLIADEIDKGQASGEVAKSTDGSPSVRTADTYPSTFNDLNLDRRRVSEWREVRDAGRCPTLQ